MATLNQAGNILLVEDHADTAAVFSRLLRACGYQVTVAQTLREGLQRGACEHFDLLIADIGLPDGSGVELVKDLHQRFGLRAIAVSGYAMANEVAAGLEAGCIKYLTKPVAWEDLRDAVDQVLGQASQAAVARRA